MGDINRERERARGKAVSTLRKRRERRLDESEALDLVMWGGSRMGVCHAEDLVK